MEVYIIRDGQQIGPFDEGAIKALIKEGRASQEDMAWRAGLPAWLPLKEVLSTAREVAPPPAPESAVSSRQSGVTAGPASQATPKQRALLSFLGIAFAAEIQKQDAALLVSDALENPRFHGRLNKWSTEKFRQYPDIFADELEAKKENRATHYYELCQIEGAGIVENVTKAHSQVLIDSLDNRFPSWESNPREALWDYFFPGLAEHFPQLVTPEWRNKLKQTSPKLPGALTHSIAHSAKLAAGNSGPTILQATLRGLVGGFLVLGLIVGGWSWWKKQHDSHNAEATGVHSVAQVSAAETANPSPEPEPNKEVSSQPIDEEIDASTPIDSSPKADTPEGKAAIASPPLPEKPGADPRPEATVLPSPAPAPKDVVTLKKAVQVQLPLGKVTLNAGTRLKFIAAEGALIRASFNDNVILVPKTVTDADAPPPTSP